MKRYRHTALLLAIAGLSGVATVAHAEPAVLDTIWTIKAKESNSDMSCTQKDGKAVPGVMIWRTHTGDENAETSVACATLKQGGEVLEFSKATDKTYILEISNESNGYSVSGDWEKPDTLKIEEAKCPNKSVMVGRRHQGDENGATTYTCMTLIDAWGQDIVPRRATMLTGSESKFLKFCPENQVMTGRAHEGDENGVSAVECASLF